MREQRRTRLPVATAANLLMAAAEGRVSQFCRSDFQQPYRGLGRSMDTAD